MTRVRFLSVSALAGVVGLAAHGRADAQAWALPAGTATVSISYQRIDNEGHRLSDGTRIPAGMSLDESVFVEAAYGLSRRWSVSLGVPYVFAKFVDPLDPPPWVPFPPRDSCRCWQSALQDVSATARYNAVNAFDHALAITPSVSLGVPSHAYEFQGEAVAGRRLRELRLSVDVGYAPAIVDRRLSIEGHYAYAVNQHAGNVDVPNNRSNATLGASVDLTRRLTVSGFTALQRTHGGLRFGTSPDTFPLNGEINTDDLLKQHDRLLRDNYVHVGFGASFRLADMSVFASYVQFVGGTDTHAGRSITAGVVWRVRR